MKLTLSNKKHSNYYILNEMKNIDKLSLEHAYRLFESGEIN